METIIKKWGNSPALRLPAALMKASSLELEQRVNVTALDGKIIIEPLETPAYQLDELLKGMTRANAHGELGFGGPVGKESL